MGFILESALMKVPLLNLKSGKVDTAVESFRSMLMAEEGSSTSSLRLGVPGQFSEVFTIYYLYLFLMHSVSDKAYNTRYRILKEDFFQGGMFKTVDCELIYWKKSYVTFVM